MAANVMALFFYGFALPAQIADAPVGVDAAKKALLEEYEPAARKLDESCRKLRLKARIVANFSQGEYSKTVQYMANGRMLRLEIIDPVRNDKVLETRAVVSHPKSSFRLVKKPNSTGYIFAWGVPEYHDFAGEVMSEGEVPFAPFAWRGRPIANFLKQRDLVIESVENVSVDGELLRRVTWRQVGRAHLSERLQTVLGREASKLQADQDGKQDKPSVGWFLFDPSHAWVLRGHGLGPYRSTLEYDMAAGGIPLLKRMESWREGSNGSRSDVTTADIQEIVPGDVPETEFTVAAFTLGLRTAPDVGPGEAFEQGDKKRRAEFEARSNPTPVNLTDSEITQAWLAAHPAVDRWGRRFLFYVLIPVLLVIGLVRLRASRRRLGDHLSSRWTEPGTNWRRRKKRPPIK